MTIQAQHRAKIGEPLRLSTLTPTSFTNARTSGIWLPPRLLEIAGQTIYKPGELQGRLSEVEQNELVVALHHDTRARGQLNVGCSNSLEKEVPVNDNRPPINLNPIRSQGLGFGS